MSVAGRRRPERVEAVRRSTAFDAGWYAATHADVAMLGMDPAEHFERFGPLLRRPPRPGLPTGFYVDAMGRRDPPPSGAMVLEAATAGLPAEVEAPAILWAAHRLAGEGEEEGARALAAAHLPPGSEHLLHVLDASRAARGGRADAWLRALNAYLAAFALAPLILDREAARAAGNVLAGLGTGALPAIGGGPRVTVLMAAHDAEATVGYAVRSILRQTWAEIELIVVDDRSRDGTIAAAERAAAGDARCRVLRNPVNAGPYVCRNAALPLATGDYVTCHDADDWAHPERIARQLAFVRDAGAGHAMAGWLRTSERGEVVRIARGGTGTRDGATAAALVSLMMERRLLGGVYGHWDDLRFGADSELIRRIEAVEGRPVPRLPEPLLLGLDRPGSLTNDAEHGHGPDGRAAVSPSRRANREAAARWHARAAREDPWLPFPHAPRLFEADPASLNDAGVAERVLDAHRRGATAPAEEACDLLIVTNLRFPGGNCSSTLDEVRTVRAAGRSVRLVHCPMWPDFTGGRAFTHADRYASVAEIVSSWHEIGRIHARRLVVRHPRVLTSASFAHLAPRLRVERADVVVNNTLHRPSGERVYDPEALVAAARALPAETVRIVPLSPAIRRELAPLVPPDLLAAEDWSPTFDVASYTLPPKDRLAAPFRLGRHGRDHLEKWLSDAGALRAAYPGHPDFEISILGGAEVAGGILGGLPANWTVIPFGALEPRDYLRELDVLAYYPNERHTEAFGRTIAEAMIAARPVLLPPRFAENFGPLAHYAEPREVEGLVRRLAAGWEAERARLLRVQREAIARFSSFALAGRFPEFGLPRAAEGDA